MASLRQQMIDAPPGGVLARHVGAVTGPLTLRLSGRGDGKVHFHVAYEGADEFYELTGSPRSARAHLAREVAAHLQVDAGPDEFGNARPSDLRTL